MCMFISTRVGPVAGRPRRRIYIFPRVRGVVLQEIHEQRRLSDCPGPFLVENKKMDICLFFRLSVIAGKFPYCFITL